MPTLRRHQLVRLHAAGWASIQEGNWDADARECLAFWAEQHLPLVVTQQAGGLLQGQLALGLPAPLRWHRRRLTLQVSLGGLLHFDEFPMLKNIGKLLPRATRDALLSLSDQVAQHGAEVRVYGSYGWQQLTGLDYLRAGSDLDLHVRVPDASGADLVAAALGAAPTAHPRLDGELVFADGSAVSWREWLAWRSKRANKILVKRLSGVALESCTAWLKEPQTC